jgi:DNA-binding MarR family transcriptional regulator
MGLDITRLTVDQALNLWRFAVVESVRRETPDLSSRQMAVLMLVYLTNGPHTVRGLARTLDISKPAITRALDRLGEYGLLCRQVDETDRRSVLVQRTPAGHDFLASFGTLVLKAAQGVTVPVHETASVPNLEVA